MMLMTKFGKFKLRFIATIHMAALLSIFNVASTASSYWVRYRDSQSGGTHFAGLWRSCPNQGACVWKNGIISHEHSVWSYLVRVLIGLGTIANIAVVGLFVAAFIFKLNKKSRYVIRILESANITLLSSFIVTIVGFCIFISSKCNYSLWLHVIGMCVIMCTCNLLTRTFAGIYFQNTRFRGSKSVETGISHSKLPCEQDDLDAKPLTGQEESIKGASIEMGKISEASGSNEALIQTGVEAVNQSEPTATTPLIEAESGEGNKAASS